MLAFSVMVFGYVTSVSTSKGCLTPVKQKFDMREFLIVSCAVNVSHYVVGIGGWLGVGYGGIEQL